MPIDNISPQATLTVTTISRPKRVAFLINPDIIDGEDIDEIFKYCLTVWGGKFYAIIPTSGQEIKPDWWKLLTILDPDIIYSYVPLQDTLVEHINRNILPIRIKEPRDPLVKPTGYRPYEFDIGALTIEDIPRSVWNSRNFFYAPTFFYIKESNDKSVTSSFVLRNFGTFPGTINYTEDALFRDIPYKLIEKFDEKPAKVLETIFNEAKLYPRRITVPADFCGLYASRKYVPVFDPFMSGFHIVVGDSPLDALYMWNRGLISSQNNGRNTFWIPKDHCLDDDLLTYVAKWINENYWGDQTERGGKVISYSIDEGVVQDVAKKISNLARYYYQPVRIPSDKFPCPNVKRFEPHSFERATDRQTDVVPLSENKGIAGFQRPHFLFRGHPQFGWMVDCIIQYHPERYDWTNIRPIWQLPKRLGIAWLFLGNNSRIIEGGIPSVEVTTKDDIVNFEIPSDNSVFWTFLNIHGHSNRPANFPILPPPTSFDQFRTSDKGRYLRGLVSLFGNLYNAGRIFEDTYWRDVLLLMAGRPDYVKELKFRSDIVLREIKELFSKDPTPIFADTPRANQLAEELARKLPLRDRKIEELTKKQLVSHFSMLRGKALKANPHDSYWQSYQKFDEWRGSDLQSLLEDKIFLQGAKSSCPHCGTRQWYLVDNLKANMRCDGCLMNYPLPPEPEWSFRLNSLVSNALRKHGLLPVLYTLYDINRFPGMFLYLPCQDIYKGNEPDPYTDIDIMVIKDGKFIIGEVKSDPSGFEPTQFEKLKEISMNLLPDELLIAAPGDSWPSDITLKVRKLSDELKAKEIKVSPILLKW